MNRTAVVACAQDQTTMPATILGVILDDLAMEDSSSHFVSGNEFGWRVHGIESVWQIKDTFPCRVAYGFKKGCGHSQIISN